MTIFRYLIKELYSATIAITLLMLLILIVNQTLRFLSFAVSGKLLPELLWQILLLQIPYLLIFILPFSIFLGVIFVFGRLNADQELIILQANGYSSKKLLSSTVLASSPFIIILTALSFWITPMVAEQKDRKMAEATSAALIDLIKPKQFIEDKITGRTYYAENIDSRRNISELFVFEKETDSDCNDAWSVVTARNAGFHFDEAALAQFLVLEGGHLYEKNCDDDGAYRISTFDRYFLHMPNTLSQVVLDEESATMTELWKQRHDNLKAAAELNWRIALPITTIVLIVIALWLNPAKPKAQKYTQLLPAILIYILYMNLLFLVRDAIENGELPAAISFWIAHVLFIILLGLLSFSYKTIIKKIT